MRAVASTSAGIPAGASRRRRGSKGSGRRPSRAVKEVTVLLTPLAKPRRRSEFATTLTLEKAMVAPATIGSRKPATARGMAAVL